MKKIQFFVLLIALVALIPFACSKGTDNDKSIAEQTSQTVDDAAITASVKAKFTSDDVVKARNIDVDTQDGLVSLRGTVASQSEADRAVRIAEQVDGIRQVRSYLKLDTAEIPADSTDTSEELKQTADNLGDKIEDGADKIGNQIEKGVDAAGEKTADAAITAEVKLKLASDDLVKARSIDVDTENKNVTLKGTVSSKAEEKRAIQIARAVEDVRSVRSDLSIQ